MEYSEWVKERVVVGRGDTTFNPRTREPEADRSL